MMCDVSLCTSVKEQQQNTCKATLSTFEGASVITQDALRGSPYRNFGGVPFFLHRSRKCASFNNSFYMYQI